MTNEALTPRERKAKLRERLAKVLKQLPDKWIETFIHVNPEYEGKAGHLRNVRNGLSLDESVIAKLEDLAVHLEALKNVKE